MLSNSVTTENCYLKDTYIHPLNFSFFLFVIDGHSIALVSLFFAQQILSLSTSNIARSLMVRALAI